jgi:hypothetical protein
VGVATANRALVGDTAVDHPSDCALRVECLPLIMRRMVSTLFTDGHADYERIFLHLLRYAQADSTGRMATLTIPNQWKLHQQDSAWPCCYATLNTFIRLLCALGILCKVPRRKNCVATYHLPLVDYKLPPDALVALDNLIDPAYTKNKRVRNLAKHVKSRLNQLSVDQQESTVDHNQGNLDVSTTLDAMQQLISSLAGIDAVEKQRIFNELDRARDQLQLLSGGTDGRFLLPARSGTTFSQPLQRVEHSQLVDCGATAVDSLSVAEGKQRGDGDALQTSVVDSLGQESTDREAVLACQIEQKGQNLPLRLPKVAHMVDSGGGNLRADDLAVDSGSFIDNDRERSSKRDVPENHRFVIDGATPESTSREPRKVYRPLGTRAAQDLAKFVEGHPGNFPAYITLSQEYHPHVLRAAIINMLAHTYFPDHDGDLPAEVDGELTGMIGRPRTPGAWVTNCCQAYAQYGIPPVMRVLLREYPGPYDVIRQCLESLARELSPKQYWMQWQESLLPHAEERSVSQGPSLPEESEIAESFAVREGVPDVEVRALVDQMNREGRPYGITASPCSQDGRWEVEVELHFQGRTSTHRFHSKREWEHYLAAIQRLPRAT